MLESNKIIGLPVVARQKGTMIGRVEKICYVPGLCNLKGLLCTRNSLFKNAFFIPESSIYSIGRQVILVDDREYSRKYDDQLVDWNQNVFSGDGQYIGRLSALMIDEPNPYVKAVVVRTSLFEDLRDGVVVYDHPERLVRGSNHIMLQDGTE